MRRWLAIAGAVLCIAAASDPSERLPDPAQEARARAIFKDVRCLVCQNESIDDSQADLAADLRKLVRDQVRAGATDAQVRSYLVSRYGEFVLLKPAFSLGNAVLWGAPFAVVLFGAGLLAGRFRRPAPEPELSARESELIDKLRNDDPA